MRLYSIKSQLCITILSLKVSSITGFLRLIEGSEVSEGGVYCVHACQLWRQVCRIVYLLEFVKKMFWRTWQKRIRVVTFWRNKGTVEGFCSINSETVTDATNSPILFAGSSADVGDMLLHGQIVRECYAHICLQGKQKYPCFLCEWRLDEDLGERFCSRLWVDCFIITKLEFVWCHPCLYIWNATEADGEG